MDVPFLVLLELQVLRACRPGKKSYFGPPARNRKKNSSRDWSRNWPCLENREKMEKKWDFPGFELFFPIFSAGPISGPQSRELLFSYSGPEARNPFFTRSAGSRATRGRIRNGVTWCTQACPGSGLSFSSVFQFVTLCFPHLPVVNQFRPFF